MRPEAQMKLLNLYKGKSLKHALHRLDIAERYVAQKQTELRVKLVTITIGD